MKKFMTVLLVIAVMFTFSFSTAFAVTPTTATYAVAYSEAVDYAVTMADAAYDKAVAEGLTVATDLEVSAEAWAAAKADYLTVIKNSIKLDANGDYPAEFGSDAETILAKKMNTESTAYALFGEKEWYSTAVGTILSQPTIVNKAARAEFKIQLDKAYDILANKVDLAAYSGTTLKAVKADIQTAERVLDQLVDGAVGAPAYTTQTAEELRTWYFVHVTPGAVGGAMAKVVPEYWNETVGGVTTNATGTVYATGLYLISGYNTDADVASNKVTSDAEKAALKAIVAKNAAAYLAKAANQTATGKAIATDYQTVLNYMIDEDCFNANWALGATVAADGTLDNYGTAADQVETLVAYAAKYAAEKDAEGKFVRDAEDIQDIVDAATLDIYATAVLDGGQIVVGYPKAATETTYTLETAKTAIENETVEATAAGFEFAQKVAIEAAKDDADAKKDVCYDVEDAKVDAALAEAIAAIEAATKASEIEQADYNLTRALKAIKTKTSVDSSFDAAPIQTEIAAQATVAKTYIDYVNTGKTSYAADRILYTDLTQIKDMLEDYYIAQGARTAAEVKASALTAEEVAAKLPTIETKAAALKAAEDAVKALPAASKVVAGDQAAIEAAIALVEAAQDAGNTVGVQYTSKLSSCIDTLEGALKTELLKAYSAADKTDKVALRNVQAMVDDFNDLYHTDAVLEENAANGDFVISGIATNLEKIMLAEEAAVEKAINLLPINITEADKAAVEAARAAYDAYVADWTKYTATAHNAANDIENFRTLALAEATLGLTDKSEEIAQIEAEKAKVEAIAAIEGLKIKASSSAKKGSITVKWTVSEEVEGVKYQVYKSTKAQKGYKKSFTTSKTSFKNTKNLTKGTRYFYKVRAIGEVDGVTYYSDWSNKANRIAK